MTSTVNIQAAGTNLTADAVGNLDITLGALIAGEDIPTNRMLVENRYTPFTVTTAGTITIKNAAGFLHTFNITGGQAGAVTVYDNTSASGVILLYFDNANQITPMLCDWTFSTGLTIVTTANTLISGGYR